MLRIYAPSVKSSVKPSVRKTKALPAPAADPWPRLKGLLVEVGQEAGTSPAMLALLTELAVVAHAHYLRGAVAGRLS